MIRTHFTLLWVLCLNMNICICEYMYTHTYIHVCVCVYVVSPRMPTNTLFED